MEQTVKIRFVTDYTVDDEHRHTVRASSYKAGKTYNVSPATAAHFVSRGKAEYTGKA